MSDQITGDVIKRYTARLGITITKEEITTKTTQQTFKNLGKYIKENNMCDNFISTSILLSDFNKYKGSDTFLLRASDGDGKLIGFVLYSNRFKQSKHRADMRIALDGSDLNNQEAKEFKGVEDGAEISYILDLCAAPSKEPSESAQRRGHEPSKIKGVKKVGTLLLFAAMAYANAAKGTLLAVAAQQYEEDGVIKFTPSEYALKLYTKIGFKEVPSYRTNGNKNISPIVMYYNRVPTVEDLDKAMKSGPEAASPRESQRESPRQKGHAVMDALQRRRRSISPSQQSEINIPESEAERLRQDVDIPDPIDDGENILVDNPPPSARGLLEEQNRNYFNNLYCGNRETPAGKQKGTLLSCFRRGMYLGKQQRRRGFGSRQRKSSHRSSNRRSSPTSHRRRSSNRRSPTSRRRSSSHRSSPTKRSTKRSKLRSSSHRRSIRRSKSHRSSPTKRSSRRSKSKSRHTSWFRARLY